MMDMVVRALKKGIGMRATSEGPSVPITVTMVKVAIEARYIIVLRCTSPVFLYQRSCRRGKS